MFRVELARERPIVQSTGFRVTQAANTASRRRLLVGLARLALASFTKGAADHCEKAFKAINYHSAHVVKNASWRVGLLAGNDGMVWYGRMNETRWNAGGKEKQRIIEKSLSREKGLLPTPADDVISATG